MQMYEIVSFRNFRVIVTTWRIQANCENENKIHLANDSLLRRTQNRTREANFNIYEIIFIRTLFSGSFLQFGSFTNKHLTKRCWYFQLSNKNYTFDFEKIKSKDNTMI